MGKDRKIIHVDMDAFFAAVEQRDNPDLRGKPVIVGGDPNGRGVVSTASYEARRYGVHSAMPLREAKRRCPEGIFVRGHMQRYVEVSRVIRQIFARYTPLVEPLSLDEAFLDVTGSTGLFGPAVDIARNIKREIKEETGLVASVGVAPNKFLAKLASDMDKPDGFVVITRENASKILTHLPVEHMHGVGKKTAEKLRGMGLLAAGQVAQVDEEFLVKSFGVFGKRLHELARGIDETPVVPNREVKSIGHETTFSRDSADREFLEQTLLSLAARVGRRARRAGVLGRTVNIKVRFANFRTVTRSQKRAEPTDLDHEIYRDALELFRNLKSRDPIRLLGVSLSSLIPRAEPRQLNLFANKDQKEELAQVIDKIRDRFGDESVTWARLKIRKD